MENGLTMEDFVFWMWNVLDVHKPIINMYGKYPWKESTRGRKSSEEEEGYSNKFWGGVDNSKTEVAKRVREDVVKER